MKKIWLVATAAEWEGSISSVKTKHLNQRIILCRDLNFCLHPFKVKVTDVFKTHCLLNILTTVLSIFYSFSDYTKCTTHRPRPPNIRAHSRPKSCSWQTNSERGPPPLSLASSKTGFATRNPFLHAPRMAGISELSSESAFGLPLAKSASEANKTGRAGAPGLQQSSSPRELPPISISIGPPRAAGEGQPAAESLGDCFHLALRDGEWK